MYDGFVVAAILIAAIRLSDGSEKPLIPELLFGLASLVAIGAHAARPARCEMAGARASTVAAFVIVTAVVADSPGAGWLSGAVFLFVMGMMTGALLGLFGGSLVADAL